MRVTLTLTDLSVEAHCHFGIWGNGLVVNICFLYIIPYKESTYPSPHHSLLSFQLAVCCYSYHLCQNMTKNCIVFQLSFNWKSTKNSWSKLWVYIRFWNYYKYNAWLILPSFCCFHSVLFYCSICKWVYSFSPAGSMKLVLSQLPLAAVYCRLRWTLCVILYLYGK